MGILKTVFNIIIFSFFMTMELGLATEFDTSVINELNVIHLQFDKKPGKKLLYFWASWCPDCKESLRDKLSQIKKSGIEVLTVNVDRDIERAKNFIKEENILFPVVRDEDKKLRKMLSIFAVPSWAVIDLNGVKSNIIKVEGGTQLTEIKKALGLSL